MPCLQAGRPDIQVLGMLMTPGNIRTATEQAAQTRKRVGAHDGNHPSLELGISSNGVRTWSLRVRDSIGRSRRFPF